MEENKDLITEDNTVYEVITKYPQLKEVFIKISPKYKRLYNPVLFNTVAKVTKLKKAAEIGNIYVKELLYQLNSAIGKGEEFLNYFKSQIPKMQEEFLKKQYSNIDKKNKPDWFEKTKNFKILDAREIGDEPFPYIMEMANSMKINEGFLLIQNFVPSPIISYLENMGFDSYVEKINENEIKIYFFKRR